MSFNYSRYILLFLGLVFFVLALKSINNDIGGFSLDRLPDIAMSVGNIQWDLFLFFLIGGYVFVTIGFHWKKIFLKLSKITIGISVILITSAIFLYPIHSGADEIVDSIQPSIDYIAADSFDSLLNEYMETYEGTIEVILSNNSETKTFYGNNITSSQADYLSSEIGLSLTSDLEKIVFSKILITSIYQEIEKNSPEAQGVPIPLNQVSEMASQQVDLNSIQSIDVAMLESIFEFNDNAYLVVLISQGSETRVINPSSMKKENVELLWDNLGLDENTSYQSKKNTLETLLSASASQLENSLPDANILIPIDVIKHSLPEEVVYMLGTDIMSDNVSLRADSLQNIRTFCYENNLEKSTTCSGILITEYENLMSLLSGQMNNEELDDALEMTGVTPEEMGIDSNLDLSAYDTLEKVETEIENMTDYVYLLFFSGIFLLIIAGSFLYFHYHIIKEEKNNIEIFFDIAKMNFWSYLPTFIFILLIWYLINSDLILSLLQKFVDAIGMQGESNVLMIKNLPIYKVLMDINSQALILASWYLIISLSAYLGKFLISSFFVAGIAIKGNKPNKNEDNEDNKNNEKDAPKTELSDDEKKAKEYILKYKSEYSKNSLKDALVKSGIQEGESQKYLDKYF